jgi:hypothetical protein
MKTPVFRERYPEVLLEESHMIVQSGHFVTAGAALSHMNLALWADPADESAACIAHGEIPHRRCAAVAIRLRADRPSRPRGSDSAALRTLGALAPHARILHGPGGTGCRSQQKDARAPHASTKSRRVWVTQMGSRCARCCAGGSARGSKEFAGIARELTYITVQCI